MFPSSITSNRPSFFTGAVSGGGQWTRAPPAPPPGVVGGVGVGSNSVALNNVSSQSTRGRRATAQRHSPASQAMQMPHGGLSAAAVQALANGWSLPGALTQAQTQQVLRLAQVRFWESLLGRSWYYLHRTATSLHFFLYRVFNEDVVLRRVCVPIPILESINGIATRSLSPRFITWSILCHVLNWFWIWRPLPSLLKVLNQMKFPFSLRRNFLAFLPLSGYWNKSSNTKGNGLLSNSWW